MGIKLILFFQVILVFLFLVDKNGSDVHDIITTKQELRRGGSESRSESLSSSLSHSLLERSLSKQHHHISNHNTIHNNDEKQKEAHTVSGHNNHNTIENKPKPDHKVHFNTNNKNNHEVVKTETETDKEETSIEVPSIYDSMDQDTTSAFLRVFGSQNNFPPLVDFPDLRYRHPKEIRTKLKQLFMDLPPQGFLKNYKNPCWYPPSLTDKYESLVCLPYAYILGQPKCGTSDLYERLKLHPDVAMPLRKEVRFFTRGMRHIILTLLIILFSIFFYFLLLLFLIR